MTSDAAAHEQDPGPRPPRLTRSRDQRIVAGVCAGMARSLGVDPLVVRVAVVVLTLAGGTGAIAYVAAWLFLPVDGQEDSVAKAVAGNRRWDPVQVLAAASVALGVLLIVRNTASGSTTPSCGRCCWPPWDWR